MFMHVLNSKIQFQSDTDPVEDEPDNMPNQSSSAASEASRNLPQLNNVRKRLFSYANDSDSSGSSESHRARLADQKVYDRGNYSQSDETNELQTNKASGDERMKDSVDDIEYGEFLLVDQLQLRNKSGSLQEASGDNSRDDVLKD